MANDLVTIDQQGNELSVYKLAPVYIAGQWRTPMLATGSGLAIIDEGGREITVWSPVMAKKNRSKIEALIDYAVETKDTTVMNSAAEAKLDEESKLVTWWDAIVRKGGQENLRHSSVSAVAAETDKIPADEARDATGFSQDQIDRMRKSLKSEDYVGTLLHALMARAHLIARDLTETEKAAVDWTARALSACDQLSHPDLVRFIEKFTSRFTMVLFPLDRFPDEKTRSKYEADAINNRRQLAETQALNVKLTAKVAALEAQTAAKVAPQLEAEFEEATKAVSAVVTPFVARYRDMPSKQLWMSQRFDEILQGRPVVLRGQGDASYQLVRDFEALEASVQWAVIAEIKRGTRSEEF